MSEELRTKVRQVIADKFGEKLEHVTENMGFEADLFGDSLDEISLACALEDEFGIEISEADARKLITVKEACDYVEHRVGARFPNYAARTGEETGA